ncbi:MAG: hypothetical protein ACRD3W_18710 [Terriglobales bacterium]
MTVNREHLYAELERLSAEEIEAGLQAGIWSEPVHQLVEHYLDQLNVTTMQFEAAETAQAAALEAAAHSRRAASWAIVALIIATGSMVASALVALLALRHSTW